MSSSSENRLLGDRALRRREDHLGAPSTARSRISNAGSRRLCVRILSPRYDEAPKRYFDWSKKPPRKRTPFSLSKEQLKRTEALLKEHSLEDAAAQQVTVLK